MIRSAISSLMMIFGILLAYGIAVFSPDAVAFLSSEASNGGPFLLRLVSLCAEPFVLYYGQGAWLWAVFFFGGGMSLYKGITPKVLVQRILAAHAAAFLLGLFSGLFLGSFSYQTAGVGGVLLGRALVLFMPAYVWLPFVLALLLVSLCFTSSFPGYLLYRIQRALQPRPLPAQAAMPDTEEENIPAENSIPRDTQTYAYESETLPQRRPLPDDGTPSFLRPIEVEPRLEDYELPKERSAFYEKMRENTLELDESSASAPSYRYALAPETIDEGDGESVFKIPAEEDSHDSSEGFSLLKPRPLARLSFDIPAETESQPIDPLYARRSESLETDDTRFIPLQTSAPSADTEPSAQVKTFTIDEGLPQALPEAPMLADFPIEEGEAPYQETLIAGTQDDASAEGLILPEDYETSPINSSYMPPDAAESTEIPEVSQNFPPDMTETEASPITDTDEIRAASAESEGSSLDSHEESVVHKLEARTKEKSEALLSLKEKLRRRHQELSKLYFHAGDEPSQTYTPEDIEDYLGEEIASLKAAITPPSPQGYVDPAAEDFYIQVPSEIAEEVPPISFDTEDAIEEPLPAGAFESLPAELPPAVEVPEENQTPLPPAEDAFIFDAAPEPAEHYVPEAAEEDIITPPAYSQYDVDNLITLNDRVYVEALLEEASSQSMMFAKDEVPFSAISSQLPQDLGGMPPSVSPSEPAYSLWSPATDQYLDKFLQSTEDSISEDFNISQQESSEGLPSDIDLQIIQEAEEAKEEFIQAPILEAADGYDKISVSLDDLAQISNFAEPQYSFSGIAPTADEIAEFYPLPEAPAQTEQIIPSILEGISPAPPETAEAPAPPRQITPSVPEDDSLAPPESQPTQIIPSVPDIPEDDSLAPPEAALMPQVLRAEVTDQLPSSIIHPPLIDPVFPSSEMLTPNTEVINIAREDAEIDEMVHTIEQAFESFNITMKVVDYSRGPAITRFELEPPAGLKLRTIRNLQDDIALQLGTSNIRIISPVEGRSFVGIEVPNTVRSSFLLKEFIEGESFQESKAELPLILGMDIGANKVCGDLTTLPHLLVAGTTGSGKSVYINALISGLLFKLSHHDLKFIMIDPKMVELELYNGIPHLLAPIITKPEEAMAALDWAVQEMDRRYKLLSDNGVRNIKEYTALTKVSFLGEDAWEHLPYIVIIVDEFANLMLRSPKDTEKNISRLAAMARAVGMHLVIATQRPSVDVVTGIIKANFPCRIAFRVSSKIDSRTILDRNGAEALLGKGDMLYISPEYNEAERMQSPFVPGSDVESIVETVKKNGPPNYIIDFEELLSTTEESDIDGSMTDALSDPMFAEVLRYAVDSGEISASGIQRRFRVGYNRASRLIETLKDQRIIAPPSSAGKGWQVLISKDQIVNYLE